MFQKDAIVRLLRDNDPATVALLKEQLIESGSDGIAALRDLLNLDDEAVTAHVREVLEKIETDEAHDDMLSLRASVSRARRHRGGLVAAHTLL